MTAHGPGRAPRSRFYDGRVYARTLDPLLSGLHQYVADQIEPTGRILDVGCGTGDLVWRLAPKADEVVGIELSPAMVEYANEKLAQEPLPNASFLLGDATTALAHLPDGHFSLATVVLVLHEMPAEAQPRVLAAVARVARRLLCVDFRAPMPWNLAGVRNRFFEITAGLEHYRAFREFQREGGSPGAAERAGLPFEHVRYIDARTTEVGLIRRER
jgi:SAM-dependent methyltransferase